MVDPVAGGLSASSQKDALGALSGLYGIFVFIVGILFALMLFFGKPVETP